MRIRSSHGGGHNKFPGGGGGTQFVWATMKIGGGGFVSGGDIAADGTTVVRTDSYGAYLLAAGLFQQLLTTSSMPSSFTTEGTGVGVYEIRIAPSNTSRFYMNYNGCVFRTDNRGGAWTQTAYTQDTGLDANDNYRAFYPKIAIDPANADVAFVCGSAGVKVTTDAGSTWNAVSGLATPSPTAAAALVIFDPSSSVVGNRTQGIYISIYGTGVYHSTNGGSSFSLTSSTPTTHVGMDISTDGVLYLLTSSSQNLSVFNGSWASHAVGAGGLFPTGVAAHPSTAGTVIVIDNNGDLSISTDHGSTWTGKGTHTLVASDMPWLTYTNGGLSNASIFGSFIKYDPSLANTVYVGWGLGVLTGNPPATQTNWTLTSKTATVEQLVSNWVVVPPGGVPICAVWDQGVFQVNNPDSYATKKGTTNNTAGLSMAWCVDWASSAPNTIVALVNWFGNDNAGYSSDGGATWNQFASRSYSPNGNIGGCIAAASATNFVIALGDSGSNPNQPYYTTDGGASWTAITMTGVPTSGVTGWVANYYQNSQVLTADRVLANTFYAYNNGQGTGNTGGGVWRSTDGGANWTKRFSGQPVGGATGLDVKLRAVPSNSGHLFFSQGKASNSPFVRSTDGGTSWSTVTNVTEVWCWGYGMIASGQSYPAIYIAGYLSGTWGIYRSIDNCVTWTNLGGFPLGIFSEVVCIEGDPNVYGKVYVGLKGCGFVYGSLR